MFTGDSFSRPIVLLLSLSNASLSPEQVSHRSQAQTKTPFKTLCSGFFHYSELVPPIWWLQNILSLPATPHLPPAPDPGGPMTDPGAGVLIPVWSLETRDIKHEDCKIICIQFLPLLPFLWLHWALSQSQLAHLTPCQCDITPTTNFTPVYCF